MQCQGWVQDKATKEWRPCKRTGNAVAANEFCQTHQCEAVRQMLNQLIELERTLQEVHNYPKVDPEKVQLLEKRIFYVKEGLTGAKDLCEKDPECATKMRDILVGLEDLLTPGGRMLPHLSEDDPIHRMKLIYSSLDKLSTNTKGEDVYAKQVSQQWELNKQRQLANEARIESLQEALTTESAAAESQEIRFQKVLQNLNDKLSRIQEEREKATTAVNLLRNRLDECQAQSSQVSGVYTQSMEKLKQVGDEYKARYEQMLGREISLSKQIAKLTESERQLENNIETLKANYEQRLIEIQNHYAGISQKGGTVLSDKEHELQNEVDHLKSALEKAIQSLEISQEAGKKALEAVQEKDRPRSDLARDLMQVNAMLADKTRQIGVLEDELNQKRSMLANRELYVAQQVEQSTAEDRATILQLRQEITNLQRQLAHRQQEVADFQMTTYNAQQQHESQIRSLTDKLRLAQSQLSQVQAQHETDRRNMQQQLQLFKNQKESARLELQSEKAAMKNELNQQFLSKSRELQDRYDATRLKLEEERRQIITARAQAVQTKKLFDKQQQDLEAYRNAYEQKMATFLKQKDELSSALTEATNQARQFGEIEADYKKRVLMLRQKLEIDRHRYETQLRQLKEGMNKAVTERNQILNSLEKCTVAREGVVAKVHALTEENTRMKEQMLQMKSRMDMMRAQYDSHIDRMRTEAAKMENDVRSCASKLQDASLVHDHVKQMQEEARALRTNLEKQIMTVKSNDQAVRRLLKDRELGKQEIIRLQSAIQHCASQRKRLEESLKSANTQIRDVNRMQGHLSREIHGLATEYQHNLETQEADMKRAQLRQQVQEAALQRKLMEVETRNASLSNKNKTLTEQKAMTENALADAEIDRARQIQLLLESQAIAEREGTATNTQQIQGQSTLWSI